MINHKVCFHGEIRKTINNFSLKKASYLNYATMSVMHVQFMAPDKRMNPINNFLISD